MLGYVYLIGSQNFGWYKIGRSSRPKTRIRDIGILLPFRIDVFAIWKTYNPVMLERELHEKYAEFGLNGEWFNFTSEQAIQIMFDPDLAFDRIYPIQGSKYGFISLSNIEKDQFKLNAKRFTKKGKIRPSFEICQQIRIQAMEFRRAWKEYLIESGLPDIPENRRLAKDHIQAQFTMSGKAKPF